MSNWIKIFTAANVFLFQKTKGGLGNRMGGQSVLLLHTTGRKSGKSYVTSLSYYREGNAYLLVASNWGKETHPDWFLNLMQNIHMQPFRWDQPRSKWKLVRRRQKSTRDCGSWSPNKMSNIYATKKE